MLLSSILQILTQYQPQPQAYQKAVAPPSPATFSAALEASGLQKIRLEIAAASGLLRPLSPEHIEPVTLAGPSLEELMQTIAKLREPNQSRVVDVFE
jgi:hypothetical protein